MADRARPDAVAGAACHGVRLFWAIIALTVVARCVAGAVLAAPLGADSRAYTLMAQAMAHGGAPVDQFGNHAFYSIGYPLFLTPLFALFGAHAWVVVAANAALAAASGVVMWRIGGALALGMPARLLAVAMHALWVPGIWNSAMPARENLSVLLLLLVILGALRILDAARREYAKGTGRAGRGVLAGALLAGLAYGAAILTGGSSLL
ncbi:MAG: hypothetical protein ACKOUM_09485, partial [Sphingopyxis sp.]